MKQTLLILTIGISLNSCSKNSNDSPCEIYPLTIGNEWIYATTFYDENDSISIIRIETAYINETKIFNGSTFYATANFENIYFNYIRNKDCNTLALFDDHNNREILIANNVPDNNTVEFSYPPSGTVNNCIEGVQIIGYTDRSTINDYDCFRVDENSIDCNNSIQSKNIIYISEGVGIVRVEAYIVINGLQKKAYTQDLTGHKFN